LPMWHLAQRLNSPAQQSFELFELCAACLVA